jgi:hypothetical protein
MISIGVSSNIDATLRRVQAQARQIPFAIAKTLTQVARTAAQDVQTDLPRVLDRPTQFTVRSIAWKMATKQTLTSEVYIRPAAAVYLAPLITGGVVKPKRRALLEPVNVALNQYGNLPPRKIKQLLARKDTFSGTINGIGGIWQRIGAGRVKLLVAYQAEQQKRKQFDFGGMVARTAQREFPRLLERNLADAMASAR